MKKKSEMNYSILVKNISLLFLIISAALFSTSFAGRVHTRKSVVSTATSTTSEGGERWEASSSRQAEESDQIHGRVLKVKTNDYGNYDPAPALVKPPFKLIPN